MLARIAPWPVLHADRDVPHERGVQGGVADLIGRQAGRRPVRQRDLNSCAWAERWLGRRTRARAATRVAHVGRPHARAVAGGGLPMCAPQASCQGKMAQSPLPPTCLDLGAATPSTWSASAASPGRAPSPWRASEARSRKLPKWCVSQPKLERILRSSAVAQLSPTNASWPSLRGVGGGGGPRGEMPKSRGVRVRCRLVAGALSFSKQ